MRSRDHAPTSWLRSIRRWRPTMLATSIRQPSRPSLSQWRNTRSIRRAQLRGAPVQRRERTHADPARVPERRRAVEEEHLALGRSRIVLRAQEPVVAGAAVIERQVADDANVARVRCGDQRTQRLVPAQQRIDALEAGRVVAVRAPRREEWRHIDEVRAELLDVVEVLLDAAQVAAVQLARRVAAAALRKTIPLARDRPVGPLRSGGRTRRRKPVREDLVHDRARVPGRRTRIEREHEVVGSGDLMRMQPEAVHPAIAGRAAVDDPAIADVGIRHLHLRPPPRLAVRLLVDDRLGGARLAVGHVPQPDVRRRTAPARGASRPPCPPPRRDGRRRTAPNRRDAAPRTRPHVRLRDAHPLTAPCERPLTMYR